MGYQSIRNAENFYIKFHPFFGRITTLDWITVKFWPSYFLKSFSFKHFQGTPGLNVDNFASRVPFLMTSQGTLPQRDKFLPFYFRNPMTVGSVGIYDGYPKARSMLYNYRDAGLTINNHYYDWGLGYE